MKPGPWRSFVPTKKIKLPNRIDLDHFISVQAHDLRTPFNHIIGFSKMTLNTVGDAPLTAYQKDDLGTVYRSGLRALALMNGLIDIARLNRHEKELKFSDADIQQMIDQGLAQWKKSNPSSEAQLETRVLGSLANVHVDEQLVRQIICGFITYVSQYCEGKVKISLTAEPTPEQLTLTFQSIGAKVRAPSVLDLEMLGYINRAFVELHAGKILQAEENDQGALISFVLNYKQ